MKMKVAILVCTLVIFLTGCATQNPSNSNTSQNPQPTAPPAANNSSNSTTGSSSSPVKTLPTESMISASQLAAGIKSNNIGQIVDVREPSEYATGHVPKAVNIPLGSLTAHLNGISKDKEVVLVDLNGTRSFTAWQTLTQRGYAPNKVKVLVGGMEQWKSLGSGEVTESIGGC